jgi:hypothetical protein
LGLHLLRRSSRDGANEHDGGYNDRRAVDNPSPKSPRPPAFSDAAAIIVSSATPSYGPFRGGVTVTIRGQFFHPNLTVDVGGRQCCQSQLLNSTTMLCALSVANRSLANPTASVGTRPRLLGLFAAINSTTPDEVDFFDDNNVPFALNFTSPCCPSAVTISDTPSLALNVTSPGNCFGAALIPVTPSPDGETLSGAFANVPFTFRRLCHFFVWDSPGVCAQNFRCAAGRCLSNRTAPGVPFQYFGAPRAVAPDDVLETYDPIEVRLRADASAPAAIDALARSIFVSPTAVTLPSLHPDLPPPPPR